MTNNIDNFRVDLVKQWEKELWQELQHSSAPSSEFIERFLASIDEIISVVSYAPHVVELVKVFQKWEGILSEQYNEYYVGRLKFVIGNVDTLLNDMARQSNKTVTAIESAKYSINDVGEFYRSGNIDRSILTSEECAIFDKCKQAQDLISKSEFDCASQVLDDMCNSVQTLEESTYNMAYLYSWGLHLKGNIQTEKRNFLLAEYRFRQSYAIKQHIELPLLHLLQTKVSLGLAQSFTNPVMGMDTIDDCCKKMDAEDASLSAYDSEYFFLLAADAWRLRGNMHSLAGDHMQGREDLLKSIEFASGRKDKVRELVALVHLAATGYKVKFETVKSLYHSLSAEERIHPLINLMREEHLKFQLRISDEALYNNYCELIGDDKLKAA